jgi:Zn-dependent peptidase ImmA (M78 family)
MTDQPTLVIRQLRQLVPPRPLKPWEARRIVELQANRFREILGINTPELPDSSIVTLPRVRVAYDPNLPVSGATAWNNGRWLILINALEDFTRQRFSLAHEFFHVVNFPTIGWLLPGTGRLSPEAEQLAEYFGGCLLAPKRHLLRLAGEGYNLGDLATTFGMSPRAVSVRLRQLHLRDETPRCGAPLGWSFHSVVPIEIETREVSHG